MIDVAPSRLRDGIWPFLSRLARRFREDHCAEVASELSFITVFALVPLMGVLVPVLAIFPTFREAGDQMEAFVFRNFVPEAGESVLAFLRASAERATELSWLGMGALLVTVLVAMATIEHSFDGIWRTGTRRPIARRLLVYWALLTLGPLLLAGGIVATSWLSALPRLNTLVAEPAIGPWTVRIFGWTVTAAAFTLLYGLVPNRPVRWRPVLPAALVATVLFELAKKGFALYIATVPTYRALFGALATIPIFLLWIYISWTIALLGAEIARLLEEGGVGAAHDDEPGIELVHGVRLVVEFAARQEAGKAVASDELRCSRLGVAAPLAAELASRLEAAGILHRTRDGELAGSRPLAQLTVAELRTALGVPLPKAGGAWRPADPCERRLAAAVAEARTARDHELTLTVGELAAEAREPAEEGAADATRPLALKPDAPRRGDEPGA